MFGFPASVRVAVGVSPSVSADGGSYFCFGLECLQCPVSKLRATRALPTDDQQVNKFNERHCERRRRIRRVLLPKRFKSSTRERKTERLSEQMYRLKDCALD